MTLIELKKEIERLIQLSGYSKADILALFDKEDEYNYDEILAYSVALDYVKDRDMEVKKNLQKLFDKRKSKLMKLYAQK
jgi:cupin superfamily acireductone dioxygenase involved in methionine salvage